MKNYTDFVQCKKLAEILPLDSADMVFAYCDSFDEYTTFPRVLESSENFNIYERDIPCWSLAALLDILKDNIKIEKTGLDQSDMFTYSIVGDGYDYKTYEHRELIDACYEMIVKLHEKNELVI
jgi:hypothetical protein